MILTGLASLRRGHHGTNRTYSIGFKRQVALEFLGGEALLRRSKRHDISHNLIRIWVAKYEAGEFDEEAEASHLLDDLFEAKKRSESLAETLRKSEHAHML